MTGVGAAAAQLELALPGGGSIGVVGCGKAVVMAGGREQRARTYWENAGPGRWQEVVVRVRYGPAAGSPPPGPDLPLVTTGRTPPRNVLVERPDGTAVVRPVRLLRTRCPG